jgi:serine phosphatase RsbU (regulator of sigma subunit)
MDSSFSALNNYESLQVELAEREAELAIINSVQLALSSRLDVQSIYNLVGDKIRDIFDSQIAMISTYDPQADTMEHRYAIEQGEHIHAPGHFPVRGFRTQIVETRQPVLVNTNVAELAAQLGQPTLPGTVTPKTWLGVPMIVGDQLTGILSLQDVSREYAFDKADVRLLQTLAASMSVALENARLWEQEALFRKALEREFEIGREIQAGFLPDALPQPDGWEITASLQSAREVTGDFYDAFELAEGKIGLVIADVCDKGLGAALFMTLFRSLIRAVANIDFFTNSEYPGGISTNMRLQNAMSLTNNYFYSTHGNTSMFCTIFFGILDTNTGLLEYINAGNIPPVVIDEHGVKEALKLTSPAVGVMGGVKFNASQVVLTPGDIFFAYTDGMMDVLNAEEKYFSEVDLLPQLVGNRTAGALLIRLQERIHQFATGGMQNDDITMLAVRRL